MKTIARHLCRLVGGCAFCGCLLAAGAGAWAAEGEAPRPKPEASAEALLQQLLSNDYEERRKAEAHLEALGEGARAALEGAVEGAEDLETRETARSLLAKLSVATLRAIVVDAAGKPQEGIAVNVTATMQPAFVDPNQPQYQQDQKRMEATTDAMGQASFSELKPLGAYLNFEALKDHFFVTNNGGYGRTQPTFQSNVKLRSGVNVLYLEIEPKGRLTGSVTGLDGTAVASAKVTAILDLGATPLTVSDQERDQAMGGFGGAWMGGMHAQVTTSTGENGKFEFEKLGAGRYFLVARSENGLPAYTGPVEVKAGEAAALDQPLRLAPIQSARTKVKLKVQTPDGNPCASSQVYFTLRRVPEKEANDETAEAAEKAEQEAQADKLYENWGSDVPNPMVNTDEKGLCEAGRHRPGTYFLEVYAQNRIARYLPEVKVSGEEQVVEVRFEDKSGSVVGNIPGAQNAYAVRLLPMDRPGASELLADGGRLANWIFSGAYSADEIFNWGGMNFWRGQIDVGLTATPDEKGFFRFEKVPPGAYAAVGVRADMSLAVMHGIQVEPGKTAQAPQFPKDTPPVVANAANADQAQLIYQIKVKVLLPDGQPAANAPVYLASDNGSSGFSTNAQGIASTNWYRNTPLDDTRLVIVVAGHVPHVSKLPPNLVGQNPNNMKHDENLPEILVKLKAMEYGDLKVRVVDENGQPVAGACVSAVPGAVPNFMGNNPPARTAYTSASGVATMRQMAPGKRTFNVWREGYFLAEKEEKEEDAKIYAQGTYRAPSQLETTVTAGQESTATATMYRALTLEGIVRTSDGKPVPNLGLYVNDATPALALVQTGADGRFHVSGLRRGPVYFTLQLGGRVLLSTQPEEMKAEDGKVVLEVGPAVPLKIRVQAQDVPQSLSLLEPGCWDPRKADDGKARTRRSAYGAFSSEGVAELDRVPPGDYDAIITGSATNPEAQSMRVRRAGRRGFSRSSVQGEIPASRVVRGIKAKAPAAEGAGDVPPLDLKLEPQTGRLALRVVLDPEQAKVLKKLAQSAYFNVTVVGENGYAVTNWNLTDAPAAKAPIVAGVGPTPSPPPAGDQRVFTGLPPGSYTVVAKVYGYEKRRIRRGPWVQIVSDLLTLGTVEVKANPEADPPPAVLELKLPDDVLAKFNDNKEVEEPVDSEYDNLVGPDYQPPVRP